MSVNSPSTSAHDVPSLPVPLNMPDESQLITEDDTPVDSIFSEKQQRLFTDPLNSTWKDTNGGLAFAAMTNVGLFFDYKEPPVVPYGLLSLRVRVPDELMKKEHRSYFLWRYRKPPELILEVVSGKEGDELGFKKQIYARIGVLYYVVWDPMEFLNQGPLQLYVLRGKEYERGNQLWFPEIGLGLTVWRGKFEETANDWLRWCDQQGNILPTAEEGRQLQKQLASENARRADAEMQRADIERQRADAEKQRAEAETARAQAEKDRAAKLADKLRAMGLDPDEV